MQKVERRGIGETDYVNTYQPLRSGRARASALVAALLAVFFSQWVQAGDLGVPQALFDKATDTGEARVIVTLQAPASPAPGTAAPQAFEGALRSAVAGVQSAVLNRIPARAFVRPVRRFPFTAQFAASLTREGLAALSSDPQVREVHEDIPVPPVLDQSVPHIFPSYETSAYSGAGWVVAVLDTGVDKNHPFLDNKVVSEACYSSNYAPDNAVSVCPGGVEESTAPDSGLPCPANVDGCDHGTHVAGIAAGDGSSFGGVATAGGLIAVQVFSEFVNPTCSSFNLPSPCALTYTSDQILGLQRVYELRNSYNIAAANMSLGGGRYYDFCDTDPRKATIDLLRNAGIATAVASGNNGWSDSVTAPACISSAVAVGSSSLGDTRSAFSNNGPPLDLYAPGEAINSSVPGTGFSSWYGTSMATPHVAGAWAVLREKDSTSTVDEIEAQFKGSGVTITSGGISAQRIDVDGALGGTGTVGRTLATLQPCRIADTRQAGGMLAAGEVRDFYVWGGAEIQSQGGSGDCGVPPDASAIVLNVTAAQMAGAGHFRLFAFDKPLPNASILNFAPDGAIANATTIPICQPFCIRDISVYTSQPSHAVIDVMGYFK